MDNNLKVSHEGEQHQYVPCRNPFISDLAWIIQITKKSATNFVVGSVANEDIITREHLLHPPSSHSLGIHIFTFLRYQ